MSTGSGGPPASKMRQWPDEGDTRNKGFCAHCGGPEETRDHNPSKVFLDNPLPANLPVASSCAACNAGFSDDEEYVACLLECVIAGHVEPDRLVRASIGKTLAGNGRLQREILAARREQDGQVLWDPNTARLKRIAVKLARGLVDFELNEPQLHEPDGVGIAPLLLMSEDDRRIFEGEPGGFALWPELGSRAFHRVLFGPEDCFVNGWIVVQQDRFRYRVTQEDGMRVRMVMREYLGLDVVWE
ncbi:MAG: hypothetical protein ACOYM5_01670 [Caulobacter sp.]